MKKVFYNKLLIAYSVITFVLTLIFFSFYTLTLQSKHVERVGEQNSVLFSTYVDEREELLSMLINMSSYIKLADSLGSFAFSSSADYYPQLTALFQELSKTNSGNRSWQCDYIVHKLNDSTCVTNFSTLTLRLGLQNLGISEEEYKSILSGFTQNDLNNKHFVFYEEKLIYVSTKSYGKNQIVVTVALNNPSAAIKEYGSNSFAGFWLLDKNATDMRRDIELPNNLRVKDIQALPRENQASFEKDGWSYSFLESSVLDATYYFADHRERFDESLGIELIRVIPILLVTFALAFVAIILVSRRLYSPIDKLLNTFVEIGVQDADTTDSKNEIDYLSLQVSKIRHKNQDLVSMVEESESLAKNRLLYDVLMGSYNESTIAHELEHFGYEWLNEISYVVTFELQEDWLSQNIGELEQIYDKINDILLDELQKKYQAQAVGDISQKHYFIVHCEEFSDLHHTLNQISTLLDTAFSIPVILFISKPSERFSMLQHSYMTLGQMQEERNSLPVKSLYSYTDFGSIAQKTSIYPISIESKLLAAIENGNRNEISKLLDYIFDEYVQYNFDNKQTKNTLVFAFANTINRAIQKSGVTAEQIFTDESYFFLELKMSSTQEELREHIQHALESLLEHSSQMGVFKSESMREAIEAFTRENITKDLSLISMADHFKLSPNYMSSIFKTVMNDNFKDYVSRYRFKLAVKFLEETPSITLAELAEKIGINSVTTLIRLFKKHADCSPGQYQKKLKAE